MAQNKETRNGGNRLPGAGRGHRARGRSAKRERMKCPHCGHALTLKEILFVGEGGTIYLEVHESGPCLRYEYYDFRDPDDSYFICKECGEPLDELTQLGWTMQGEREIIRRLK